MTKFALDVGVSGGTIRTTRLLDALRSRFDVEVLGFGDEGERATRSRVSTAVASFRTGRPYQNLRYDTPWFRRELARMVESFRPDAIHADYLHVAPVAWDVPLPRALDLHNVESALSAGIGASSGGLTGFMARRDARLLRAVEERASRDFALITVPSAKEATRMPGNVHVVVNGVDVDRAPLAIEPDPDQLCFVGTFGWVPNIDGAEWLVREVLPLLPEHLRIQLVGRNPHRRVLALAGPRVDVTGEVPDTFENVCRSSVVLAPLLAPGGTRHKILEGLLAARPVVATPEAADGLEDLEGDGLVLAPDAASFAKAAAELAADPDRAAAMGRAGRAAVIARYGWPASQQKLLDLYEEYLQLS